MAQTKVTSKELSGTIPVTRHDSTTNTPLSDARIEVGWGAIPVTVANSFPNETITFATAFTTRPIVMVTWGGDAVAGPEAYGSGGHSVHAPGTIKAVNITTTNFLVHIDHPSNANWGAGNVVYYQWMAVGQ